MSLSHTWARARAPLIAPDPRLFAPARVSVRRRRGSPRACRAGACLAHRSPPSRPRLTPLLIAAKFPSENATVTGRISAVLSAFTVNTYVPCGPRWMAAAGTTVLFFRTSSSRCTFTNWLGQSERSRFSKTAFSFPVPVVASIWLSMVVSVPVASFVWSSRL